MTSRVPLRKPVAKLDSNRYELVLTTRRPETMNLLAYARVKDYHPATAIDHFALSPSSSAGPAAARTNSPSGRWASPLLEKVADLIGLRASRRYRSRLSRRSTRPDAIDRNQ